MAEKGSCTITYRMKLYCKHPEWLIKTKNLYNEVELFYYTLLQEHSELWKMNAHAILRELEKLTIKSRTGKLPIVRLPFERLPLYFRRAAINAAIAMHESCQSKYESWKLKKEKAEQEGRDFSLPMPGKAEKCSASPVFYKGMYKEFSESSIMLKLFTGNTWCWIKCKVKGRAIPKGSQMLSPSVVISKKRMAIHVPVKREVSDARNVKERMEADEHVCGVTFSNSDAFAVCVIYSADGRVVASRFVRGGKEYTHYSKRRLNFIRQNRKVMGRHFDWTAANKKHWVYLSNLRDYWSHKVSREILNFCKEYHAKIISIVKADPLSEAGQNFQKVEACKRKHAGAGEPYGLSNMIKRNLQYKAWQDGIVITGVRANYTSEKCNCCRSYLDKEKGNSRTFRCKNGHTGNRDLNTAKNIAQMSLKKFGKTA